MSPWVVATVGAQFDVQQADLEGVPPLLHASESVLATEPGEDALLFVQGCPFGTLEEDVVACTTPNMHNRARWDRAEHGAGHSLRLPEE